MKELLDLKKELEKNNFEVYLAENPEQAFEVFVNNILSMLDLSSISYADSKTMIKTNVIEYIKNNKQYQFIDTFDPDHTWKEQIAQRKRALNCDLFLTGTNAITKAGQLVNLDMIGNRTAALSFGPRNIVLFIGKNKIVENLDLAFKRIKEKAAVENAKAHPKLKLACQKTGVCVDCQSPQRICNTWTITEKSYPKNRIKIILINQDLGF
ncbi:MAG: lactate utilization protein [Marinifilaceae bacterium]|jgi:L-lactate utilization protein LutC|nr:lactate utilization protein [Marinifilaceae bacterium]